MTTRQSGRRVGPRRLQRWAAPAMVAATLLGTGSSVGAATTSVVALNIAKYAVATATHERPAHVVTAADVSNAVDLTSVNTKNLYVLINLDQVIGYSRLVLLFDQKRFSDTCINFPNTVGGAPRIIPCPHRAQGLVDSRPAVMIVSGNAVAAAASRARAVSGPDVVKAAARFHLLLVPTPTFVAGQGGKVKFATPVEMGANVKFTVYTCVRFPKTAYGIPVQVAC